MTVSVVVPWRDTDPDRAQALAYVTTWWADQHPAWELVVGTCPDGPWVKALAVADALTRARGDLLVVTDADVLVPGVGWAVQRVEQGHPWAMPHSRVYRLGRDASQRVYATGRLPDLDPTRARAQPDGVHASYVGVHGGGCVVLSRALYQRVPLDPRFTGWGQEDEAWARGLDVITGGPARHPGPLWHLWHPPARTLRAGETPDPGDYTRMTRAVGTPQGAALFRRYRGVGTAAGMEALLAEFRPPVG